MFKKYNSKLNRKKRYLQIALNNTLDEAEKIIAQLPQSDRIIVEAGTPLIKAYGIEGIRQIKKLHGGYVVADLKMMDRGETEVDIARRAGADAAVALGVAPIESLNAFIAACEKHGLDSMIDMMNVEYSLPILRKLKKPPTVVILHRGVDEEHFNHEKQLPLHEIRRIKSNYNIMVSVAGGDTLREVQKVMFNDADIAVVWKSFYQSTGDTAALAEQFLKEIK